MGMYEVTHSCGHACAVHVCLHVVYVECKSNYVWLNLYRQTYMRIYAEYVFVCAHTCICGVMHTHRHAYVVCLCIYTWYMCVHMQCVWWAYEVHGCTNMMHVSVCESVLLCVCVCIVHLCVYMMHVCMHTCFVKF